jgi:hypothetical protein
MRKIHMKLVNIINWTLKIIGFAIGFAGGLLVIGSPGALDQGTISILQFIGQELGGILLIGVAFGIYVIREIFKYEFVR